MISGKKRNERVRWLYYNSMNKFNKLFHSDSSHYQRQFFMQKDNKFHILQSFDKNHKIAVSPYYHESAGNFFKALSICEYVGEETKLHRHFLRNWYIGKFPNSIFNYNATIYEFYLPKKFSNLILFKLMTY